MPRMRTAMLYWLEVALILFHTLAAGYATHTSALGVFRTGLSRLDTHGAKHYG